MFKFEEICELIQLVGSSGVANVEVEHAGSRVRIEGRAQVVAAQAAPSVMAAAPAPVLEASIASEPGTAIPEEDDLHPVSSPIVGTFYRAPNPDADPYVKVGDFVEQGQTLCIVEAMKLMNEIEADISGMVVRVLPENAQPVEYGESLFMVRPA
ncbi:MAG: acetyl-CoA carboxylase biotin carboxyl carrier protein [Acidobacteria bacterium]|nr:acetyl-CoA carboxylase biotin carboxyl carrier protein [Candidatus Sulfomarinibacter kjeldsenii]MBD3857584.1 acetyl-CoA carboxylase biotin carboxyl carrier protein [Candidatus Sulfomarinibacter kjeldsenii]